MDFGTALWGIGRDIRELTDDPFGWLVLIGVLLLPVRSAIAVWKRMWSALLPLAIGLGVWIVWVLYYATDWWADPGIFGLWYMVTAVLLGWLALGGLMLWRRRRMPRRRRVPVSGRYGGGPSRR